MKKKFPKFKSPEEAALFWENNEILDFVDENEFKIVDPRQGGRYSYGHNSAHMPKRLISLRVGPDIVRKAQELSRRRGVGYQSVLRNWLEKGAKKAA